jgi:hypothetical protein
MTDTDQQQADVTTLQQPDWRERARSLEVQRDAAAHLAKTSTDEVVRLLHILKQNRICRDCGRPLDRCENDPNGRCA